MIKSLDYLATVRFASTIKTLLKHGAPHTRVAMVFRGASMVNVKFPGAFLESKHVITDSDFR